MKQRQGQIAFFKMPKTASGYIKSLMKRGGYLTHGTARSMSVRKFHFHDHILYDINDITTYVLPNQIRTYCRLRKLFTFVRHPLVRLVSAYYWVSRENNPNGLQPILVRAKCKKFDDIVHIFDELMEIGAPHFIPQHQWIYKYDTCLADFVGRYENLPEDWEIIKERYGLEKAPCAFMNRHVDKDKIGSYSDSMVVTLDMILKMYYKNNVTLQKALEFYARDMELFHYDCP